MRRTSPCRHDRRSGTLSALRRGAPLPLALALLAFAGCGGDGTGPLRGFDVTVRVASLTGPTLGESAPGEPTVGCQARLAAVGSGLGTATWLDGSFLFYIGKDTIAPVDSVPISRAEILQSWEAPTIADGETRQSTWVMSAGIPFTADLVFRYQPGTGGDPKRATVRIRCTPPISAEAPAPTIASVSVTPSSGAVEAGTPMTVSYSASAAAGLWQTRVLVSGPCQMERRFSEALAPSTTRSVDFLLPSACQLGLPIAVRVQAFDAAGQGSSRTDPLSLVLSDHQPPAVFAPFSPPVNGGLTPFVHGDYFAGDTIRAMMGATDNHRVAAIVWEVLPYGGKDSVVIADAGAGVSGDVKIALASDYAGPVQIRFYARDAMGLTSPFITTPPDSIRVRPTIQRPTRVGTIPGRVTHYAIDGKRGVLYLAMNGALLNVVSLSTLTVTGTLSAPSTIAGLDVTPGGDSLVVGMHSSQSLGIVDLRQATPSMALLRLSALDPALGQAAGAVRALANGHVMVAAPYAATPQWGLLDVDLRSGAQRFRTDGATGGALLSRSADGAVLVLNNGSCLRRYVASTDAFGPCAPPRVGNWEPVVDGTGARFALGNDVYDATMTKLPQLGGLYTPGTIGYSALSSDGLSLFEMLWTPGIIRRRAADGALLDRTPNPLSTNMPARMAPDGSFLVLMEAGNDATKIAVIDMR